MFNRTSDLRCAFAATTQGSARGDGAKRAVAAAPRGQVRAVAVRPRLRQKAPGEPDGIRMVANEPDALDAAEYLDKLRQTQADNDLPDEDMIFVEVTLTDPSDFETALDVRGEIAHERYRVLRMESSSVANALAALLLHVRDETKRVPHIYFEWTEGNPLLNLLRFLFTGAGEVAPVTREVLREAEPDRTRRPRVHVG